MAENKDFYKILGVNKNASKDEIKRAYRRLAKKYHPDVNPGNKQAEQLFKDASTAHEVLSDQQKRKLYDEFGSDGLRQGFDPDQARAYQQWTRGFGSGGSRYGNADDVFSSFRAGGGAPGGGLNLEDLLNGMFPGQNPFSNSSSGGADPFAGGSTSFGRRGPFGNRRTANQAKGPDAHTTIQIDLLEAVRGAEKTLTISNGPGSTPRTVRVRIPAGVQDGGKVRVPAQGAPGQSGGPPGDLVLEIQIRPHPRLRRVENDLELDVPVTVAEAFYGAKVQVPTPDGTVTVTIPPDTRSGTRLRLKGRGISRKGKAPGDFYAIIQIQLPDSKDQRTQDAIAALRDAYRGDVRADLSL